MSVWRYVSCIAYLCQMGHLMHMGHDEYIVIYESYGVSVSNGALSVYGSL